MKSYLIAFLAVGSLSSCLANDGSGDVGVGGSVFLMKENPNIRMVSEEVFIKIPECRVQTRFVFKNSGPATSVLMIFPENGYLNTATEELLPVIRPRYTHFKSFRAWVDGRPFRVTRLVQRDHDYDLPDYLYWWVKRVPFAAGQTRVIVNRYSGGLGWGGLGVPQRSFGYVLGTGASWKGRIGSARIVCDVSGVRNGLLSIDPPGARRKGNKIVWEFRNFQPEKNARITLSWLLGFADATVNGESVAGRFDWTQPIAPRKVGSEVWMPIRVAANWLGGKVSVEKSGKVSLQRARRTALVAAGSVWIQSGSARTRSSRAVYVKPYRRGAALMVPLRLVVQALGGTSSFERSGCLAIAMPPMRPASEFGSHLAPSLIGRYHFDSNATDSAGKSDAFDLRNTEFREGALFLNGKYSDGGKGGAYWAACRTPGMHYDAFAVAVRFRPESFLPTFLGDRSTGIVTGGTYYRWFSLFRTQSGHLGVSLNGTVEHVFEMSLIGRGRWTVVSCGVDALARRVVAYQDGKPLGEFELPESFEMEVATSRQSESDKLWTFTNTSNGATFHGLVSDLAIYDGAPSRATLAQLLLEENR